MYLKAKTKSWGFLNEMRDRLPPTPLQRIVGFEVAEEIYDNLPLYAQYILDLKIAGYSETQIAATLGVAQSTVNETFKRARYYLLESKLHLILEARIHYREINPIVMERTK